MRYHCGREHGNTFGAGKVAESYSMVSMKQTAGRRGKKETEPGMRFRNLKPTPINILPLPKPYLLILVILSNSSTSW